MNSNSRLYVCVILQYKMCYIAQRNGTERNPCHHEIMSIPRIHNPIGVIYRLWWNEVVTEEEARDSRR